jgi:hypothetical protein
VEMLENEWVEADLGIDTIKQATIFLLSVTGLE